MFHETAERMTGLLNSFFVAIDWMGEVRNKQKIFYEENFWKFTSFEKIK